MFGPFTKNHGFWHYQLFFKASFLILQATICFIGFHYATLLYHGNAVQTP